MHLLLLFALHITMFRKKKGKRKKILTANFFTGVPVTTAAIVFPLIYLLQLANKLDLTMVYMFFMALVGGLFISEKKIRKPGFKHLMVLVVLGLVEAILMVLCKIFVK